MPKPANPPGKVEPSLSVVAGPPYPNGAPTAILTGTGYRKNTSVTIYVSHTSPHTAVADFDGAWSRTIVLGGEAPWDFITWQHYANRWHHQADATLS